MFNGDANWKKVKVRGQTYQWDTGSTYVKNPPYFEGMTMKPAPVANRGARVLALFGDSITTDHISPAGKIKATAPGGRDVVGGDRIEEEGERCAHSRCRRRRSLRQPLIGRVLDIGPDHHPVGEACRGP